MLLVKRLSFFAFLAVMAIGTGACSGGSKAPGGAAGAASDRATDGCERAAEALKRATTAAAVVDAIGECAGALRELKRDAAAVPRAADGADDGGRKTDEAAAAAADRCRNAVADFYSALRSVRPALLSDDAVVAALRALGEFTE